MRAVQRAGMFVLGAAAIVVSAAGGYFGLLKPSHVAPRNVRIEITPARLARGKYIYTLADCDGCHSQRDTSRFGMPVVEGGKGVGQVFPHEMGLPGTIAAPNITPDPETGIGAWTEGEKIRAIREGVGRDGRPLFPMMPYESFRHMSDEDVYSLVAYLNTLPAVRHAVPPARVDFPVSLLIRTAPRPAGNVPEPERGNRVSYGRYLAILGNCAECHTLSGKGNPVRGMEFAGGREFRFPGLRVVAANITPDLRTGIGTWSEQDFLDRFYQYRDYLENGSPKITPPAFTIMPWLNFAQLKPDDLRAIFAYLQTLKPVYHAVETHPGAGAADHVAGVSGGA